MHVYFFTCMYNLCMFVYVYINRIHLNFQFNNIIINYTRELMLIYYAMMLIILLLLFL